MNIEIHYDASSLASVYCRRGRDELTSAESSQDSLGSVKEAAARSGGLSVALLLSGHIMNNVEGQFPS